MPAVTQRRKPFGAVTPPWSGRRGWPEWPRRSRRDRERQTGSLGPAEDEFMHCTAAPPVPLVRLSIAEVTSRRPARSSTSTCTCTRLEPTTDFVWGWMPSASSWTNGSSANVAA